MTRPVEAQNILFGWLRKEGNRTPAGCLLSKRKKALTGSRPQRF